MRLRSGRGLVARHECPFSQYPGGHKMIVTTGGSSSSAPPVGAHESGLIGEDPRGARNSRQLAPLSWGLQSGAGNNRTSGTEITTRRWTYERPASPSPDIPIPTGAGDSREARLVSFFSRSAAGRPGHRARGGGD